MDVHVLVYAGRFVEVRQVYIVLAAQLTLGV